jgi:C4-dicarboxylate transporter DctM subunit
MLKLGLDQTWQFLIVMNIFLLVLGMLMDGFSAILVAVPLILPFAARFNLGPFHMAMIFLLNLEIAYCCPPLGLNLFIASFRFNRPVVSLYRVVLPFAGILAVALLLVSYIPRISDILILRDIASARADAAKVHLPPREAWIMECVQEDRTNPLPCNEEDKKAWPNGLAPQAAEPAHAAAVVVAPPDAGDGEESEDDLEKMIMGGGGKKDAKDAGAATDEPSEDDLEKMIMGGGGKPAPSAKPAPSTNEEPSDDDLEKMIMAGSKGGKKDGG